MKIEHKKSGNNKHLIRIRGEKGHLVIRVVHKGKRLYVARVQGKNAGIYFKTAVREIDSLAKKLGCKLITTDAAAPSNFRLPKFATMAGFKVSPRAIIGLAHGRKLDNLGGKLAGTHIPMHKRVK